MTLRANTPVPSAPKPRAVLLASPPRGRVEVAAPSAAEDSGTWVPATGGSFTVGFLGQPASRAAPANSNAIDIILFINVSGRACFRSPARVPAMSLFVNFDYVFVRTDPTRVLATRLRSR